MRKDSLKGLSALVTGGAQRIGRHIAIACAEAGMNVVVHYHKSRFEAEHLAGELARNGVCAWAVGANLGRPGGCEAVVSEARALCGNSLSLLVNNASLFPEHSLSLVTFADITDAVRINAWAPLCLSRAFARKARRGSIVNLLDARIAGNDRNHVAYILSKHLLAAITKMCAIELAPGIRVNAVAPGLILPPVGKTSLYVDKLKKTVPLRTHGTPHDIADAVLFLARSSFITGEIIFVDGGKHLLRYGSAY
jgi:hypothetical protein